MTTGDGEFDDPFAFAELALVLLLYGAIAGGFWTGVIVGASWLTDVGCGALAEVLVGIWLVVSAPILYAQIGAMFDVLGRAMVGQTEIVPRLVGLIDPPVVPLWIRVLGTVISVVSPSASLSALALHSLVPTSRPLALIPFKARLEIKVMAIAVARLRQ